jgi:hypothetical protein
MRLNINIRIEGADSPDTAKLPYKFDEESADPIALYLKIKSFVKIIMLNI